MNETEQICTIALTQVPGIGAVKGRNLINEMGSAEEAFKQLDCPEAILQAEKEYEFIRKNKIRCITIKDPDYPSRMLECDDAPIILFYKGNADMNAMRVINIVGTRYATEYGRQSCLNFLKDLKALQPDILVVSGLAYGIDIQAHKAALQYNLPTIGVLAHGLDRIYPAEHRKIAIEMIEKGGLLTEFLSGTIPDRYNFVSRNRIVAGMSDATIVIESAIKGGSLITADLAQGYNRECFAFPGRCTDSYSQGCNRLIQQNKAILLQSAEDFVKAMLWDNNIASKKQMPVQRNLFLDLTEEEKKVVDTLGHEAMQINDLIATTGIPIHRINSLLFEMEMKGVVKVLPGNKCQVV